MQKWICMAPFLHTASNQKLGPEKRLTYWVQGCSLNLMLWSLRLYNVHIQYYTLLHTVHCRTIIESHLPGKGRHYTHPQHKIHFSQYPHRGDQEMGTAISCKLMSDFLQECGYAQTSDGADHKPQQDPDTAADLHLWWLPWLSPLFLQIKGTMAYTCTCT